MNSRFTDEATMRLALEQADLAAQAAEVPVGAVVVKDGVVIAVGRNAPVADCDPTAHAEMVALREAARVLGSYRLDGCELFVTLEPCAMCSGAMLHARLSRVVFGAFEPKTGAAGSIINLFDHPALNHQTQVRGGVLASDCSLVLQDFFQKRRHERAVEKRSEHPLRDDALRTPDACFSGLLDYPWPPQYVSDLPALKGLRLHYLDVGPQDAPLTYLCLHGNPAWSYLYRKMIPVFVQAGSRVIAPDLIGFGKSDKPKKESAHSFGWHRQVLLELVERLALQNVILVVQDWGGLLGLTLPMDTPQRYAGLLVMNTCLANAEVPLSAGFLAWRDMCAKRPDFDIGRLMNRGNPGLTPRECSAYNVPFPDKGHRAATRAFPAMVPEFPNDEGATISRQAQSFWQNQWSGRALMAVGMQDPVLGWPVMQHLSTLIRGCPPPRQLAQAGHFVPEWGVDVAQAAVRYFGQPA
jgi:tRNA(adenine34) deaminase